jgi:hypothetical protein
VNGVVLRKGLCQPRNVRLLMRLGRLASEAPVGKKGAQFALQRLEIEEAQADARLQQALASGNQLEIEQTQVFWVRCVESLRKLDLSMAL